MLSVVYEVGKHNERDSSGKFTVDATVTSTDDVLTKTARELTLVA